MHGLNQNCHSCTWCVAALGGPAIGIPHYPEIEQMYLFTFVPGVPSFSLAFAIIRARQSSVSRNALKQACARVCQLTPG